MRFATLQRKVRIGAKGKWIANRRLLPAIPPAITDAYDAAAIAEIQTLANTWAGDKETSGREFASDVAFYQAVADSIARQSAAAVVPADDRQRWDILKEAVITNGKVTEVPWTTFNAKEAPLLLAELLGCPVQVAGSGTSTACHSNQHGKLPKRVPKINGKALDTLPKGEQANHTPYFEFLVSIGQKKKSGIERGILDEVDGLVYVTAHYDKGSIAWLSGVPQELVTDWQTTVAAYGRLNKGQQAVV